MNFTRRQTATWKFGSVISMFGFLKRDKKPRIAFRQQRDGTRKYFVESWHCYESGCFYGQESKEVDTLEEAQALLQEISDKEVVSYGVV